jgi:hypothetical protein
MTTIQMLILIQNARNTIEKLSIGIDRRTEQRIAWIKHVAKRCLLVEDAGNAVLVRRALALLTDHYERLLSGHDGEAKEREISALRSAAQGGTAAFDATELLTIPPKPWSALGAKEVKATPQAEARTRKLYEHFYGKGR